MNSKQILIAISFVFVLIIAPASAQLVPVANSELNIKGVNVHGNPALPGSWKLATGKRDNARNWDAPGTTGIAIGNKVSLSQDVKLEPLTEKQAAEGTWRTILAIDVLGKFSKEEGNGKIWAAIHDKQTGKQLKKKSFQVKDDAPISTIARPSVSASSFKAGGGLPRFAFDGNPKTIWHSDYGNMTPKHPHLLTLDFGKTRILRGVTYIPRSDRGNGTVKKYKLEFTRDGRTWKQAATGEFNYSEDNHSQAIKLAKPIECRGMRLRCLSAIRGEAFASCAELTPDLEGGFAGIEANATEPRAAIHRFFLPLDFATSAKLGHATISFGVDSPTRYVVVDRVHLFRAPSVATRKMLGKPNGHLGPDLLGAGSYGFQAMMVHQLPVLPIISIRPDSPAGRSLKVNDLIVGIENQFLPPGNVAPGYEWFESSHEALLGRAAMSAFEPARNGQPNRQVGKVRLQVLRGDKLVNVPIKLNLPGQIGSTDFLTNPEHLELINSDLVNQVISTQMSNGSWKNNPIHTCLGGLALLATHDQEHAARIKAAANWMMQRNAEPGSGFYWHPSFSGIFLCEYYLATGDERALPTIKRMLRMMGSVFHTSKWGTPTFGHGPKGLPYGNKSLVAVMVHVMVFEELAKRCGCESQIFETLSPYMDSAWSDPKQGGHGGLGYNASYKDQAEFWSRTGLFCLALHMKGVRSDMQGPMSKIMLERHPWFRNSHAYGEPGGVLGLIGLSQVNRKSFQEVLSAYRWWFALAWERGNGLHFTIPHMGAPYMEGPVLINNGYAIVTNIHKQTLQITGATERNWLDVSKIPVPSSEVMILQNEQGMVNLRCKIPGPSIHYTLDGSTPTNDSRLYKSGFEVSPGTVVRAIAINGAEASKIAERGFGFDKSVWTIVSASGHKDPAAAVRRALNAIDGDRFIGWVPDCGESAKGYPHEIIIDMKSPRPVQMAGIRFILQNGTPTQINLLGSNQKDSGFRVLGSLQQDKFIHNVQIKLNSAKPIRYLKLVLEKPFAENGNLLMVGEIDIR